MTASRHQISKLLGTDEWAVRDESTGTVYSSTNVIDEHRKVRTYHPKREILESFSGQVVECTVLGHYDKSARTILVIRPTVDKEGFR